MLPSRRLLLFALAALALALSWELGRRDGWQAGLREGADRGAAASEAARARVAERLAEQVAERSAERARLVRERDLARATVEALREDLELGGALTAEERAELELYRRVGDDGGPRGLAIETVARRPGPPEVLVITLVQVRGRDRVEGRVDVTVDGLARPAWSARFGLRFFETVELPLEGIGERFPDEVVVSVVPDGRLHRRFTERFGREAIRIVD